VSVAAGWLRNGLIRRPRWQQRQRVTSGVLMIGLGMLLAVS
jgi:threonine/homoserine/homoserine lactone efflux protein